MAARNITRNPRPKKSHEEIVKSFGMRLQKLRASRGYKQRELAQKAGIHSTYLSRLERAESVAGIDVACSLAKALEVPISHLLTNLIEDPIPLLESQARKRLDALIKHADLPTLELIVPLLAALETNLSRKQK